MSELGVVKSFRRGTHRTLAPEETLARIRRFLPVMGITRVANVTGLDRIGLPVVMVCRPNARSLSVSQGKGLDLAAAKASGLMEAAEQYHAERIRLPLKLATYNELRFTHEVVDPEQFPRTTVSPYHENHRLLWIEARDLVAGSAVWLPFELAHLDLTLPLPAGSGCFPLGSNGLASGNHILEALTHAICELVERDAVTLWQDRGKTAVTETRLDPSTVDDRESLEVLDRLDRAGLAVAIWDVTSDVGVPVFYCELVDPPATSRGSVPGIAGGAGCHPAREVALLRALTEAAQGRLTLISGSRDDLGRSAYTGLQDPDALGRRLAQLDAQPARCRFGDVPALAGETFEDDLATLLKHLRAAGFARVLAIDLTRQEFGLPVARVVIPGLEGLSEQPGYVPGPRLRARRERAPETPP